MAIKPALRRTLVVPEAILLLLLALSCGPSDADVERETAAAAGQLSAVLIANSGCAVSEIPSRDGQFTSTMERFASRMEEMTASMENQNEVSNQERMDVIEKMRALAEEWEAELEERGCDVADSN